MTGIFTTALMGFFLLSSAGAGQAEAAAAPPAPPPAPSYAVTLTAYNAVPEQTDDNPWVTASGAASDPDVVAARSVDLADDLPFGTVISVKPAATSSPQCGLALVEDMVGLRVIADSMHPRKRNQVDIMLHGDRTVRAGGRLVNPAVALGICSGVQIEVVGHIDISRMPKDQTELLAMLGEASLAAR